MVNFKGFVIQAGQLKLGKTKVLFCTCLLDLQTTPTDYHKNFNVHVAYGYVDVVVIDLIHLQITNIT